MEDHQLRGYLLGQLAEPDVERLEARLLEDQEVFDRLSGVEDDLFDEFARGQLGPPEREKFAARFESQPDKARFARALAQRAARPHVVGFPRRSWLPLAAAAGLALVVGGVLLRPERRPEPLPTPAAPAPSAVLRLGTSRSAGASSEIALPEGAPALQLRVRLDPNDRFDRYSMELRSPTGASVWRVDDLRAAPEAGELDLLASVPARSLEAALYELGVRGVNEGGSPEDLGFVSVKIVRRP